MLSEPTRFDNRPAQVASTVFFVIVGVIGVAGASQGDVFGVVLLLAGASLAVRAVRASAVVVDSASVQTRSLMHTRRHAFGDLARVDVEVGSTGLARYKREYLVFYLTDGSRRPFKEFNAAVPEPAGMVSVVQQAAAAIRERALCSGS